MPACSSAGRANSAERRSTRSRSTPASGRSNWAVGGARGSRGFATASAPREPSSASTTARDRVRAAGRSNVGVVRADATRPVATGAFDAVYAAMSITATGDADAVARTARDALGPGGRVAVLDARPFQRFPLSALNPPIAAIAWRLTNWYPDADVPGALAAAFGDVDVTAFNAGTLFVATARRPEPAPGSTSPPGSGSRPE